jgi:hypothetical protein
MFFENPRLFMGKPMSLRLPAAGALCWLLSVATWSERHSEKIEKDWGDMFTIKWGYRDNQQ